LPVITTPTTTAKLKGDKMEDIFDSMAKRWPSAIVARKEVAKFSGGLLHPRTLANLDSKGLGCPEKIKIGSRIVAYPVDAMIIWLRSRATSTQD
jgi:predicted DNA-binding transcriptional regulator AlpA